MSRWARTHAPHKIIGRIEPGFEFLGYHFGPTGLTIAKETVAKFIEKASRLYEQERRTVSAVTALEVYAEAVVPLGEDRSRAWDHHRNYGAGRPEYVLTDMRPNRGGVAKSTRTPPYFH
jgi:hypothetical protein